MNKEEVLKLAKLARIEIEESEAESLAHEFDAILNYVSEIKNAKVENSDISLESASLKNMMREDANPHESGIYTEALLAEAPSSTNGYVKVKKIL